MDVLEAYQAVAKAYDEKKPLLSKEEVSYALGRDTLRGKMLGFLTRNYYKRKKLLKEGSVVIGYAFKEWTQGEKAEFSRIWVLHSPSIEFAQNPSLYAETAALLADIQSPKKPKGEERKFLTALNEPYADAVALEIPEEYSNGHLVHLYIIDVQKSRFPDLRLGYNFFIGEAGISKEMLLLPPRFMPLDIYREYAEGGFGIG